MPKKRITRRFGDGVVRTFASEDGKHYRGEHQDLGPVIEHIKYLSEAPKAGNKHGWRYAGSTTLVLVHHWCKMHGYSHNDFASNPELKAQHMAWLHSEMSKLRPPKKKSSQILMPGAKVA